LKRKTPHPHLPTFSILPRLSSRGPIEATPAPAEPSTYSALPRLSSRGPIEAAQPPYYDPGPVPLPRLSSRGPIEACLLLEKFPPANPFRGCPAAAPLKLRHGWRRRESLRGLPRLSSRGPIEAQLPEPVPESEPVLPRLSSRGPIEATARPM